MARKEVSIWSLRSVEEEEEGFLLDDGGGAPVSRGHDGRRGDHIRSRSGCCYLCTYVHSGLTILELSLNN